MSEILLTIAGIVSFALIHAAHPRRFPYGEARWKQLHKPLGSARRTLYALSIGALALGVIGALAGFRSLSLVETITIAIFAFTTAGSAIALAAPLWPRWTWRLCAAAAIALPLLLVASLVTQVLCQVSHG